MALEAQGLRHDHNNYQVRICSKAVADSLNIWRSFLIPAFTMLTTYAAYTLIWKEDLSSKPNRVHHHLALADSGGSC